ncbi:unnamed protein product [Schistosoma margrebowiei]|uniref:Uncharacterized protein n=1 Tax=Schistosoma margrebowiei TaxID=48269 RepID=A0AA84Z4C5_9TREM|nr:unnamed protein product [Schistosoma margrebowiei]
MKLYFIFFLLVIYCEFYSEAKSGRVRCSAQCWETGIKCKNNCKNNACNRNCQDGVRDCIRDVCRVSEHVDTYDEHQLHD